MVVAGCSGVVVGAAEDGGGATVMGGDGVGDLVGGRPSAVGWLRVDGGMVGGRRGLLSGGGWMGCRLVGGGGAAVVGGYASSGLKWPRAPAVGRFGAAAVVWWRARVDWA